MQASTTNYALLIKKIDEFIRRYYLNQVVRGSIFAAALFASGYILFVLAEYYGHFSPLIRKSIFFGFLTAVISVLIKWIVLPLISYFRIGKTISREEAAIIIGKHFQEVQDKLLNILQLRQLADQQQESASLVLAGIEQKTQDLRPLPFASAIKLSENKRYLKLPAAPLILILLIALTAPSILSESSERLINYNRVYIKKAPFQFVLLNKNLEVMQGNDLELRVKLEGNEIPSEVYLEDGKNVFKLEKKDIIHFTYIFRNLQADKQIRLKGSGFNSEEYLIRVKPKPELINFQVHLNYPAYLNKKDENAGSRGDLAVPEGTVLTWKTQTSSTDSLEMIFGQKKLTRRVEEDQAVFTFRAAKSLEYSFIPSNTEAGAAYGPTYSLQVIPDLYPVIEVEERLDSLNKGIIYFAGSIGDDHGFSKLKFNYRILNESSEKIVSHALSFDKNSSQSNFFYGLNVANIDLPPGGQLEYFFEVWDNDGVNGPKSRRSAVKVYKALSEEEMEKNQEAASTSLKQNLEKAKRQAVALENESRKLSREFFNKKELSYTDRKNIEQLVEKRQELEKLLEQIKQEKRLLSRENPAVDKFSESILQRQKQIEELFNNVLNTETQELLKNLEKLLSQQRKSGLQPELSKIQLDNKSLQKELDRILELYKQLEFDQKFSEALEKLNQTAAEQQQLSEQSQNKNVNVQQLTERQQDLNSDFKKFRNALKELEDKNLELERQRNFQNPAAEQDEIEKLQHESEKSLKSNKPEKASLNQRNAAVQMRQLAQKLQHMKQEEESEESQVNLRGVREVLDQLLAVSFEQENLMQQTRRISVKDPEYGRIARAQKSIKNKMTAIGDSLYSLSKRIPQIEAAVNKETAAVNYNLNKTVGYLADRRTADAASAQQYVMTAVNNTALLLTEVFEQLQNAMKNAQPGSGKKQSLSQLRKMQEQLNQNMEKARQELEQGRQGEPRQKAGGQMSEQLARMARQQQLIRQSLQEINRSKNKDGQGGLGNLDVLSKEMEQTESDLVNKKILQETVLRQRDILTKLLEAEKADQERETDNKRESRPGTETTAGLVPVLEEYKKEKQKQIEMLKTISPALNSFYKTKVGDYLKFLNSGN